MDGILGTLERKGYKAYTCRPLFNGIRIAVLPHILEHIDALESLLVEAAREAGVE